MGIKCTEVLRIVTGGNDEHIERVHKMKANTFAVT